MDPLDMISWHSMSRPGSATLGREPEMRRLAGKSFALASAIHLLILVVAVYALSKTAEALRLSQWPGTIEVAMVGPPSTTPIAADADTNADAVLQSSSVALKDVAATGAADGPPGDATRERASDAPDAGNLGASAEVSPPVGPSAPILPTPQAASSPADPPPDARAAKPVDEAPRKAAEPPKTGVNSPPQRASGRSDANLASAGPLALTPGTPRAGGAGALKMQAGVVLQGACPRPAEARARGETGIADIVVHVDARGTIQGMGIDHTSNSAVLDKAAMACIRTWKFKPALLSDDTPIGGTIIVHQRFTASD